MYKKTLSIFCIFCAGCGKHGYSQKNDRRSLINESNDYYYCNYTIIYYKLYAYAWLDRFFDPESYKYK